MTPRYRITLRLANGGHDVLEHVLGWGVYEHCVRFQLSPTQERVVPQAQLLWFESEPESQPISVN